MNRLLKCLKKGHSAFSLFASRLRDAFYLISKDDLDAVVESLKKSGLSDKDIEEKKLNDWKYFMDRVKKQIPEKSILLKRFDIVIQFFEDTKDSSGQSLYNAAFKKQVDLIRMHIKNGCLSDVKNVPVYFEVGNSRNSLSRYRCCGGTNSNENYHKHLRPLLNRASCSPMLAHLQFLMFNESWNLRMGIKNRGLPDQFNGFFDMFDIEAINNMSRGIYETPPFLFWKGVLRGGRLHFFYPRPC
jgi:hypothetical protein